MPTSQIAPLKLGGLTQIMDVPTWKWEAININFVVGLPRTRRQNDSICVIVNRLNKSSHCISFKSTYNTEEYTRIYINEIMSLDGSLFSIISDRSTNWLVVYAKAFKKGLGTPVKLNTAFHPQTDGPVNIPFIHLKIY